MTEKKLGTELLRNTLGLGLRAMGLSALIMLSVANVPADTVLDWNVIALKTTAAAPFNPPVESRNLAIVHAAIFDAVNSIVGEFRPYVVPPPSLTSPQYTRDFNEIKEIGSATNSTRTQDQTDLARFWVSTAPQIWNPAARQVAIAQGLTLSQNARAFALLNLAGADAFIVSWDAKFAYNQWRPVTAIREADTDGNPETIADPSWIPLLVTPPFPDYIAGHTTYAGAAEEVLEHVLDGNPGVVIKLTSATAPRVIESYATFDEIAEGVVDARVWGGIHWRTSSVRGRRVGQKVAAFAVRHFLKPKSEDSDRSSL